MFCKQKDYSTKGRKTYLASLAAGYDREFNPVKALVMSFYYRGNFTQSKLLEFLENIGISIEAGYLSNLLTKRRF